MKRKRVPLWLMVMVPAVLLLMLIPLFRAIFPFQSMNPLWHEVTAGQPVIDSWLYGGQDEEGYLKFYNETGTILLPPHSRTFDADGQFVIIEQYTPTSLTFAEPYDAIPLAWIVTGLLLAGGASYLTYRKIRKRSPSLRMRRIPFHIPSFAKPQKFHIRRTRRFRALGKMRMFRKR